MSQYDFSDAFEKAMDAREIASSDESPELPSTDLPPTRGVNDPNLPPFVDEEQLLSPPNSDTSDYSTDQFCDVLVRDRGTSEVWPNFALISVSPSPSRQANGRRFHRITFEVDDEWMLGKLGCLAVDSFEIGQRAPRRRRGCGMLKKVAKKLKTGLSGMMGRGK